MEIDRQTQFPDGQDLREATGKPKPVVVMLIGLPGSGKSTFCDQVMAASSRPWSRICQDSINNGKAGTKIQCLSSAAAALKNGESIFIDRCNIDRAQRADFLKLGGEQVEKHAVVLNLSAKLCIARCLKRNGHEGNLEGGKAAAVVNQMFSKKELPKLGEGFTRITCCRDEKDVQQTINLYCSFGPLGSVPSGYFGQENQDMKTQIGIMKYFKRVDFSGNGVSNSSNLQKLIPNSISIEKVSGLQGTKNGPDSSEFRENLKEHDKLDVLSSSCPIAPGRAPTLAFPSISTADFQFSLEKASDIIVEKIEEFVSRIGDASLVLVDLSHGSKILPLVNTKAAQKNIDSKRFFTLVGDITRLRSGIGLQCNVIANAANWRLKPGGGGVNAAIFRAAGSDLEIATKEVAATLSPGNAVVVPLPSTSPLFVREGVTHVIHVLGPNMNPMRPDCLKGDYVQGCKVLREAYSSLFEGFVSILRSHNFISMQNSGMSSESGDPQEVSRTSGEEVSRTSGEEVSRTSGEKGKREYAYETGNNKRCKEFQLDFIPGACSSLEEKSPKDRKVSCGKIKSCGLWAQSLYNIAMHPELHKNVILEVSDEIIVINDAYPKARHHLLVLARIDGLDCIMNVCEQHISLLRNMHALGLRWAEHFLNDDQSLSFRLGYHSEPSMRQLHLHVISQDFDSDFLKNKKHWNSFNTPFFQDSIDMIKEVEDHGKVALKNVDKFKSMELRCHRCRSAHPNIPRLKAHIRSCKVPFPAALLENGRLVSSKSSGIITQ